MSECPIAILWMWTTGTNSVSNAKGSVIKWSQCAARATSWPREKAPNGCWKPKVNTKQHILVSLHLTALTVFQALL